MNINVQKDLYFWLPWLPTSVVTKYISDFFYAANAKVPDVYFRVWCVCVCVCSTSHNS